MTVARVLRLRPGLPVLDEPAAGLSADEIVKASETSGGESVPRPALPRRMIEIETAGARVHVPEGVDAKTLSVVLAALRRAS